jgi:lipopolysaccharide biosynthesis regulator YciM
MSAWWDPLQELVSPVAVLLTGLLVLLAAAFVWALRRWRHVSDRLMTPTAVLPCRPLERGFDLLLDGRWDEARQALTEAVKADPNRVLEYLELGKLVRRRGDVGRAARMFEHLLARPRLDRGVRVMAHYELGLAYRAMGFHDAAASAFAEVLRLDLGHRHARQELRRTHEDMGGWEQAVALERARGKQGEAVDRQTLAALCTQQAKAAWVAGQLRQSMAHLRAALGLDHQCTEATLYLGRLLLRQGKLRKAFRVWKELASVRPEFLFLAFRDIQAAFRQLDNEAGWETFLQTFTERHPDDLSGHLALAEWYASQDRSAEAMARLRRVLEIDPSCLQAHVTLLTLYQKQGGSTEILETYQLLAQATTGLNRRGFRCRACGYTAAEPFWKCPACAIWATPERLRPPSGNTPILTVATAQGAAHSLADASASVAMRCDTPPATLSQGRER